MATTKVPSPDQLAAALGSGDGTLILNALSEIEAAPPSQQLAQLLNSAVPKITDTVLSFQARKTLRLLALKLQNRLSPCTVETLQQILQQPDRFEEIAIAVSTLTPADAVLAPEALRAANWQDLPSPVLPTLCQFVKKFGSIADAPALIELCRHPDPTVLTTALNALEVIDPSNIQSLVTPLLTNPNPTIRAQAIQALYRSDKAAALQHLKLLLFSKNTTEQALALHHTTFFPFQEVEPHLIKMISEVSDPKLLRLVSQVMQKNAHPELPFKLYWLCRSLKEQHQNLVKGLVLGVVRALSEKKVVQGSVQDFLEKLKARVKEEEERLLRESLLAAAALGETEAGNTQEALAEIKPTAHEHKPTVLSPTATFEDYDTLDTSSRIQLISRLSREDFGRFKARIMQLMKSTKTKEQAALIKLVGRFGSSDDATQIKPFLGTDQPDAVSAAIDALSKLDAEYLAIYLPQLMQNRNGKIRMFATKAFSSIDKNQIKSLIAGMLSSTSSRIRLNAMPPILLVDFSLVKDEVVKAFDKETTPEIIEKLGLVLCSNPDRETLRAVFRSVRTAPSNEVRDKRQNILTQLAENLSIALGKTTPAKELLDGEEKAWKAAPAVEKQPAAPVATAAKGKAGPGETAQPGQVVPTRAKVTLAIWVIAISLWLIILTIIAMRFFTG